MQPVEQTFIEQVVMFLMGFAKDYPFTASLLMFMGSTKLVVTPIMAMIDSFVIMTPSKEDDKIWSKIKKSKGFSAALFVLDILTSVKIKVKK